MRIVPLLIAVFLFNNYCSSQTLAKQRSTDWSLAGIKGQYSEPTVDIDFIFSGGFSDGLTPNNSVFSEILNSFTGQKVIVYFPNGIYLFTKPLSLPNNIILRGESGDSTILIFDLSNDDHLIKIKGNATTDTVKVLINGNKDDKIILVDNTASLAIGDHIRIIDNDDSKITSTWAKYSTGQINQIDSIFENKIFLSSPLRRSFTVERDARLIKLNLVKNVGIENLRIERLDKTTVQTSNIFFEYAFNCRVKCIQSFQCNFAHLEIANSSNIEVSGSYFKDALDYGGGGKGYGVLLHFSTGECLIKENIFNHLRHSIILQAGANGNVISYNYSFDPYWTGTSLPSNSAGDLVLHGNHPYVNLFEGNTVQNIIIDDSHGKDGPYNTFFRNRAELYGIFMNSNQPTDSLNFIGNEITNNGFFMGNYALSGTGHFEYGNNKKETIIPSGSKNLIEGSLYLNNTPEYYKTISSWPPIGLPNKINDYNIESKEQFNKGITTKCKKSLALSVLTDVIKNENFNYYPNPANETINIILDPNMNEAEAEIQIISLNGSIIFKSEYHKTISVKNLDQGLYFLAIKAPDKLHFIGELIIMH